ncbi:MAG: CvpA family protein [Pseudomonadota bacterium]
MTTFDAILLTMIVLSVLFAVIRGGLKELTTLVSLGLAALTAYFLAEPAAALAGGGTIALLAAALGVMGVAFVGFQVVTAILVSRIALPPRARLADRIGGGLFGLARSLVLIGLGFLGYAYYLDEEYRPAAVNDAMLLPIAKGSAAFIEGLAPERARLEGANGEQVQNSAAQSSATQNSDKQSMTLQDDAYNRSARVGLEELVSTVTTAEDAGDLADAAAHGRAAAVR